MLLIAHIQVPHGVAAHVEQVEVAGGVFGAVGVAGVVNGGGVEMAVAGEDRKVLERFIRASGSGRVRAICAHSASLASWQKRRRRVLARESKNELRAGMSSQSALMCWRKARPLGSSSRTLVMPRRSHASSESSGQERAQRQEEAM